MSLWKARIFSDRPTSGGPVAGSWEELLVRLRSGDRSSALRLFEEMSPLLLRLSLFFGVSASDSEDVVQDVWERMLTTGPRDLSPGSVRSWSVRVLKNRINDVRRHHKHVVRHATFSVLGEPQHGDAEDLVFLRQCWDLCDDSEREALVLLGLEGFTVREASRVLGVTESALESRWRRVRVKLRSCGESADERG